MFQVTANWFSYIFILYLYLFFFIYFILRLKAGGKGDDKGLDSWMASLTRWTWVWASSRSWWWSQLPEPSSGKPGVLQSMGLQRVRHDWVEWTELVFFFRFFTIIGYYKILSIVPCATQYTHAQLPSPVWCCDLMNCNPPGFHAHGISQARILEWVAISSSRGSSLPKDRTPGLKEADHRVWELYVGAVY